MAAIPHTDASPLCVLVKADILHISIKKRVCDYLNSKELVDNHGEECGRTRKWTTSRIGQPEN